MLMSEEKKTPEVVETTTVEVAKKTTKAPATLKDYLLFAFAILSFIAIICLIVLAY